FIRRRIRFDNVLPLLSLLKLIGYRKIDYDIYKFIDENFSRISHTPEFLELSVDDVHYLLQRNTLHCEEHKVHKNKNNTNASSLKITLDMCRLLNSLRYDSINTSFLTETIETTDWVMDDSDCTTAFLEEEKKKKETRRDSAAPLVIRSRAFEEARGLFFYI
ncbi:hypothetical protein PMAYCL1PPCAC_03488, partial [Pristionchus mayeri]